MKKYLIALDGGTTNTRLTLCLDGIIAKKKLSVGIRDGKDALEVSLKDGIAALLSENKLTEADIEAIAASGMVTSELGLYNVPHIIAPAGTAELCAGAARVTLSHITTIPFVFIPGVKTFDIPEIGSLSSMDIMRGEETETVAIIKGMGELRDMTLILPGSHMKIINVKDGRITSFTTTISGELARAAGENTILKNSIGDFYCREIDNSALFMGWDLADELGIAAALFKLRVGGNFLGLSREKLYSCLLGIILHDDVETIIWNDSDGSAPYVIGGSKPLRTAYRMLLDGRVDKLYEVPEELAENAAALGAIEIYKQSEN